MASPWLSIIYRHQLLQRYGVSMLRPTIRHRTVQLRDSGCLAPPTEQTESHGGRPSIPTHNCTIFPISLTVISLQCTASRRFLNTKHSLHCVPIKRKPPTHDSFIHSFIGPLNRRWVVVPSILLDHWLCPMRHQRRVLCRLPVVASTDGEAGHVDVSTAACCRGGDQFLP